jgi:hypothetical protein
VIVHRLELQEHEREALDMMAASYTARNISRAVNNLVSPLTQCTIAGAVTASAIVTAIIGAKALVDEDVTFQSAQEGVLPFIFGLGPGIWANVDWSSLASKIQTNLADYPRTL